MTRFWTAILLRLAGAKHFRPYVLSARSFEKSVLVGAWLSHFRHSRMLLAGIQANF
jgi:hypothetical protein